MKFLPRQPSRPSELNSFFSQDALEGALEGALESALGRLTLKELI